MAWPFTTPASGPTSFAGPGATVPTVPTEIAGGATIWLLGLHFVNSGVVEHIVTITDSAGNLLWQEKVPAVSGSQPYAPTFEPVTGCKWSVDVGTDVVGHVWGY